MCIGMCIYINSHVWTFSDNLVDVWKAHPWLQPSFLGRMGNTTEDQSESQDRFLINIYLEKAQYF